MTAVSFAVQAHPSRTLAARALAAEIGGEPVWDPIPDGRRSAWRSFRRLMETTPPGATHRLQIQDDATVCPGFTEAVRAAAAAKPDRMLVFYVGRNPRAYADLVMRACRNDLTWAELDGGGWCPVVCTLWPVPMIARLLDYYDHAKFPSGWGPDDEIVGRFLNKIRHRPLASVPSLVEHLDLVDTIGGKRGGRGDRRAACWIGDCQECAAGIDWTLGP